MAIKVKDSGSAVTMTDEQINALPPVCRVIVRQSRLIEEMSCGPVVSIDEFKKARGVMRGYVRDAARIFMPLSVKDGPLVTV